MNKKCPGCFENRWRQSVKGVVFTCRHCGYSRDIYGQKVTAEQLETYRKVQLETVKTVDDVQSRPMITRMATAMYERRG